MTYRAPLLLAALASLLACGGPLTPIDVQQVDSAQALEGITLDPDTRERSLLMGSELIRLSPSGEELLRATVDPEDGDTFRDLVDLGDGSYALPRSLEVSRYFPSEDRLESYFCLLPMPVDMPVLTRENPGITVDLDDDHIFAAPRVYEDGELTENNLVIYRVSDGGFVRGLALPPDLLPDGIAWDNASGRLLAVEGERLHVLKLGPAALEIDGRFTLDQVEAAVGAVVDGDALLVLDAAGQLITFDLNQIR